MRALAWLADRGGVLVLLAMGAVLSVITIEERTPTSVAAAVALAEELPSGGRVFLGIDDQAEQVAFADALREAYALRGGRLVEGRGTPPAVRGALEAAASETLDGLVSLPGADAWSLLRSASEWLPAVEGVPLATPSAERWPLFLTRENLLNVAETISVWAILGIGMTLVILTAGIDLSVGSLVALASVVAALLLRDVLGGRAAGPLAVVGASLAAVLTCALVGLLSGLVVTRFRVAPFIVTLGMMMAASGVALRLTGGTSVDEVPDSFAWLGHGAIAGLPVPVILMLVLYGAAWFVMHHTTLGRAIYAVGSNEEAARLAGIPVERVLVLVYTACGALAGVGGLLTASTFESGDPTYGVSYELYVIAAVVVGGTSLAGGQGRVMGTLVGSLILGVIYNGMNLTNVGGFSQRIVLGLVILLAVVLDQWKRRRALAPG